MIQPDLRVAALTAPHGSNGSGSASIAREVSTVAAVTEKTIEMRMVEEVMVGKVAEEAMEVKVVADKAAAMKAVEEGVAVKVATDEAAMAKATEEHVVLKVAMDKASTVNVAKEVMAKTLADAAVMKTTN
jgi:hypothetical protein